MRPLLFAGLGLGFILMGAGLYALTLRKQKPIPAAPTKAQLREQAAMAEENKKMRLAASGSAGLGVILVILSLF
jgi:hypothetical protein